MTSFLFKNMSNSFVYICFRNEVNLILLNNTLNYRKIKSSGFCEYNSNHIENQTKDHEPSQGRIQKNPFNLNAGLL